MTPEDLPAVATVDSLPTLAARLAEDLNRQREALAAFDAAPNTQRAYRSRLRAFADWCSGKGIALGGPAVEGDKIPFTLPRFPIASELVELWLAEMADAGAKVSTLTQSLAALRAVHEQLLGDDVPPPTAAHNVKRAMQRIRRRLGTVQHGKQPLVTKDLWQTLESWPSEDLADLRDRLILLWGLCGAFRRSELVALTLADIRRVDAGLVVTIGRSKTDQNAAGRTVALPRNAAHPARCPVAALDAWLEAAHIGSGPIFRRIWKGGAVAEGAVDATHVARIVKRAAALIGKDPALFAGHSLRSGFVTSATLAGESDRAIMAQTGHRKVDMITTYTRRANPFQGNAVNKLME